MAEAFAEWIGRSEVRRDRLDPVRCNALLAALGESRQIADGDPLPLLHHWLHFWDVRPPAGLGEDGHPAKGGFLPPIPLPRRMWAGGRLRFEAPLRVGDAVEKTSTITAIETKHGRSGTLVFVTLEHRIAGPAGMGIIERQDLVYRAPSDSTPPLPQPIAAPPACDRHLVIAPDPVLLFRYSALTMNGHRIHYDRPYAVGEEAYPALVVHGPLQATVLASAAAELAGATLKTFAFRGRSPAFDGLPLHVCAAREDDGSIRAWTQQGASPAMTATATA